MALQDSFSDLLWLTLAMLLGFTCLALSSFLERCKAADHLAYENTERPNVCLFPIVASPAIKRDFRGYVSWCSAVSHDLLPFLCQLFSKPKIDQPYVPYSVNQYILRLQVSKHDLPLVKRLNPSDDLCKVKL